MKCKNIAGIWRAAILHRGKGKTKLLKEEKNINRAKLLYHCEYLLRTSLIDFALCQTEPDHLILSGISYGFNLLSQ